MSKNEVDWNRFRKEYYRTVGATVIKALAANGFQAAYAESRQEAVDAVLSLVPEGATVGIPGSVTIRELGLPEILEARGNRIVQHWDPALQADERAQRWNDELASDIFLTSSNAVTLAGELVNIDGTGNRVAGMAWANNRICFVVGINKVSRNVESALQRIRDWATPINGLRLGMDLPCIKAGFCVDCKAPQRACRAVSVLERAPYGRDAHVILVGETLGY
ncbi:MAG: LUD domain-containing protein [Synergistaceae bacterium]|nr:LUD domain-containing protein [Synergistaceae bacterium]